MKVNPGPIAIQVINSPRAKMPEASHLIRLLNHRLFVKKIPARSGPVCVGAGSMGFHYNRCRSFGVSQPSVARSLLGRCQGVIFHSVTGRHHFRRYLTALHTVAVIHFTPC